MMMITYPQPPNRLHLSGPHSRSITCRHQFGQVQLHALALTSTCGAHTLVSVIIQSDTPPPPLVPQHLFQPLQQLLPLQQQQQLQQPGPSSTTPLSSTLSMAAQVLNQPIPQPSSSTQRSPSLDQGLPNLSNLSRLSAVVGSPPDLDAADLNASPSQTK